MGCNIVERNVESRKVRNLGDTSQTHIHGSRTRSGGKELLILNTATNVVVNRQRIKLMSVYFSHSGYADHHIEKMYKTIE